MSIAAISIMAILFFCETAAFARNRIVTSIAVDENAAQQVRLNFNITLMDLHCDYVSVDVWDALGTNRQNVTRNIDKWQLDETGAKRIFSGRNRETRQLEYDSHLGQVEDMILSGEAVVSLTSENFQVFLERHEMAFIDMYAPWYVLLESSEIGTSGANADSIQSHIRKISFLTHSKGVFGANVLRRHGSNLPSKFRKRVCRWALER
jgi:hypothetical protein